MTANDQITKEQSRAIRWNIPFAIVIGLAVQAGTAVWWASKTDTRLDQMGLRQAEFAARLDATNADRNSTGERLAKLEQSSTDIIDWLRRIDGKIDRVAPASR